MPRVHKPMGYYDEAVYEAVREGIFEIDSEGRIWRLYHQQSSRWGHPTILVKCQPRRAERKTARGYLHLFIRVDGQQLYAYAHRIVWRHFKGPIPVGLTINHKNGKKQQNRLKNLELATWSEQRLHSIHVLGNKPRPNTSGIAPKFGIENTKAKLTENAVRDIKAKPERGEGVKLAKKYKVSVATISRVRSGALWGHVV